MLAMLLGPDSATPAPPAPVMVDLMMALDWLTISTPRMVVPLIAAPIAACGVSPG
jgi:hypothetical protein